MKIHQIPLSPLNIQWLKAVLDMDWDKTMYPNTIRIPELSELAPSGKERARE